MTGKDKEKLKPGQKRRTVFTTKIVKEMIDDMNKGIIYDDNPFYMGDTNYKDANILFQMTDEEYDEYVKCSADPIYFIETYVPFENDHGVTLVKLRDYQKDFIKLTCGEYWDDEYKEFIPEHRNVISMMSRQNAKTTTMAASFIWYSIFHNDRHLAIIANKGDTVKEIYRKMDSMLSRLPFFLKPGIVAKNMTGMSFDNGSFSKGFNTSKTPAIGFTVHYLYLDEAALVPANIMNEFWTSIYPTLSSSKLSKIVLTSTPRGRQNKFFELWDKGEKGLNSFVTFRVDWWQNPDHDEAWAEQQKKDFGEIEFAQEFELQWDVAASKVVRGTDMQFINRIKKEYINRDIPSIPVDICNKFWWDPDFDPTNPSVFKEKFLLVIDTAEGKEETVQGKKSPDYNVINIFKVELMSPSKVKKFSLDNKIGIKDIFRFRQVGVYIDNNNDEEEMAKAAKYLVYGTFRCGRFNIDNIRILLEMNFNGKNFVNKFQDSDYWYDDLILKTYHTKPIPGQKQKKKFGYKTTTGGNGIGKSYFCEEGAKMITKRQIIVNHFSKIENECTISELGAFDKIKKSNLSKFYTYEGVGLHDDLAKTVLDCSRAIEIQEFLVWLEDYFDMSNELKMSWKYSQLQRLLRIAVETDEGNLSNEQFSSLYTDGGGSQFNNITQSNNGFAPIKSTYGSLMRRSSTGNPYTNHSVVNPYINRNRIANPYTGKR